MAAGELARFINFGLLAMGVATLLQTTLGNRLPIIQGPSATLIASLAPLAGQVGGAGMWGAIAVGGATEAAVGASRLPGKLKRFLPAAVTGSVIVVIGLSLGQLALRLSLGQGTALDPALAALVIAVVFLLQTLARDVFGGLVSRGAIFLAIWVVGLGVGGVLGKVDWQLVADKPWFAAPALFPFGSPWGGWELHLGAIVIVLIATLGSLVESLGDYAATCEVADEPLTEKHMNRGILAEGIGTLSAAALGGLPCTSYTQNIGIIATTRVASRVVVQVAAGVLILYGLCPKFGALLVALPRSVLGGVFVLVCGMITVSGLRLIQKAPATDRTALTVGTTLVVSLATPTAVRSVLGADGLEQLPSALALLVTNSIVLAVLLGIGLNAALGALGDGNPEIRKP